MSPNSIAEASPSLRARVAGAFYMITIVAGILGYAAGRTHLADISLLVAGAAYIVVTLLLYELLKPVNRSLSLLAAFFSIVGIAHSDNSLFFFGFYCVLIGYLIIKSNLLPGAIGVLMVVAGLGHLTNVLVSLLFPALAHVVSPIALGLGGIGEISLALWLLVMGVHVKTEEKTKLPA